MADERKKSMPPDPAKREGQEKLGQDLLAQLQHDFVRKKAEDAVHAANFGQALLGKVAQDFASGRPPPMPEPERVAVPESARPPSGPIRLAPPPSPELVRAEAQLARAAVTPLRPDEDAEVAAMQGGGLFGFIRKLFRRR